MGGGDRKKTGQKKEKTKGWRMKENLILYLQPPILIFIFGIWHVKLIERGVTRWDLAKMFMLSSISQ